MSDLFGTQIQVEVRVGKTTGKYSVTITDHGEKIACTEIDSDGDSLHSKIVEYISGQMSGKESEEAQLTKQGERALRHDAVTFDPLEEPEEEEADVYDPLNSSGGIDQFDVGYGI